MPVEDTDLASFRRVSAPRCERTSADGKALSLVTRIWERGTWNTRQTGIAMGKPSDVPCPKCNQATEIFDEQTRYQNKPGARGTIVRVPVATIIAHRCQNPKCRHIFTRTVKH
jgi:hypothetical protein